MLLNILLTLIRDFWLLCFMWLLLVCSSRTNVSPLLISFLLSSEQQWWPNISSVSRPLGLLLFSQCANKCLLSVVSALRVVLPLFSAIFVEALCSTVEAWQFCQSVLMRAVFRTSCSFNIALVWLRSPKCKAWHRLVLILELGCSVLPQLCQLCLCADVVEPSQQKNPGWDLTEKLSSNFNCGRAGRQKQQKWHFHDPRSWVCPF